MPDDAGYDKARALFYSWIDRKPAIIVRAADADDVARAITFAREQGIELAVRSGGHSIAGHSTSEGGIVLDVSEMRAMEIDAAARTTWAGSGITAGEYTNAAAAYGLATGFGDTGSVGVGGITLGGGVGFLVRKYGMTIDELLAADIVTANGQLLRTDEKNHPDLFWAIRGGGGNFGVATRLKFRLREVDRILGGILMLPATPDVLVSFLDEAEAAPEELSVIANVMSAPPMPFIPAEHHGKIIVMAMMVYAGAIEAGERVLAPFRKLAKPIADMLRPMKYPEMYQGEGQHPVAASVRSLFIDAVDRSVAETVLGHLQASTASMAVSQIRVLGGAMARVSADATAFAHRDRRMMVNVAALYERRDESATHDAWVTRLAGALQGNDRSVYVNFLGDEGSARVRDAYPGATWDRLCAIKKRYDPDNFFRSNQNILPSEGNGSR
ncbi:MAG: FAD-binding oxidoreductase [Bacteroidetes bacterium]|nr:FAD-binding oxidoreductase [Bacteroidota bacterium]